MKFLGIDLAARYSAAVLMDENKTTLDMWVVDVGAAEKPARPRKHLQPLLTQLVIAVSTSVAIDSFEEDELKIAVEDLSHFMANPAPALRLQGALDMALYLYGFPEPTLVKPTVWQAHYGFVKSKKGFKAPTTKAQAKVKCAEFGYEFDITGKAKVDLVDAALIARWRVEKWEQENSGLS